jgi:hypothetical protein
MKEKIKQILDDCSEVYNTKQKLQKKTTRPPLFFHRITTNSALIYFPDYNQDAKNAVQLIKDNLIKKNPQNFFTTFGINSQAGDIILNECEDHEKTKFFKLIKTYLKHAKLAHTELQLLLLKKHFLSKNVLIEGDYYSFRENVITTIYRDFLKILKQFSM